MALTECGECKRQVSDKARACPACGAPIAAAAVVVTAAPVRLFPVTTDATKSRGTFSGYGKWIALITTTAIAIATATIYVVSEERAQWKELTQIEWDVGTIQSREIDLQHILYADRSLPESDRLAETEKLVQNAFASRVGDLSLQAAEAKHAQETADRMLVYVTWVSLGWLALVTVLFGAILALGWREWGLVKTARDDSNAAAKEATAAALKIKETENQVMISAERVSLTDRAVSKAVIDLKKLFEPLPNLEIKGIVGKRPKLPTPAHISLFEDADLLIVYAEKMGLVVGHELFDSLMRLGRYWRVVQNFPRAIARFNRAMELDPKSADAKSEVARTLYMMAVFDGVESIDDAEKEHLLTTAKGVAENGLAMAPDNSDLLFNLGWIADEQNQLPVALDYYLRSRAAEKVDDGNITYNIACTYSRMGKQKEALEEIGKVLTREQNWEDAETDKDLHSLRGDPICGPQLAVLISACRAPLKAPDGPGAKVPDDPERLG